MQHERFACLVAGAIRHKSLFIKIDFFFMQVKIVVRRKGCQRYSVTVNDALPDTVPAIRSTT